MDIQTVVMLLLSFLLGSVITAFGYTVTLKADMEAIKSSPLFKNAEMVSNLVVVCKEHDQLKATVLELQLQMKTLQTQHSLQNE